LENATAQLTTVRLTGSYNFSVNCNNGGVVGMMDSSNISITGLTLASVFTVAGWSAQPNSVGVVIGET